MSLQRRFADQFNRDAMAHGGHGGHAVRDVAEWLRVSTNSFHVWKALFTSWRMLAFAACLGIAIGTPALADEAAEELIVIVETVRQDVDLLSQFRQLERYSEELVYWQTMAILGGSYDWKFQYSLGGPEDERHTLRLYNALDETQVEAIRAMQAIRRSRSATSSNLAVAEAIYLKHLEMREIANQVLALLRNREAEAAADLYRERAFPLRKDILNASYSVTREIETRIAAVSRQAASIER